MLNRGENRTRDLVVTSPYALPSELHGQPDFKTVNYDIELTVYINRIEILYILTEYTVYINRIETHCNTEQA